ncbi:MAG: 50S ribosomal protein L18 [Pyramidobacter sp.]|nr:50S ribosomal protein L18 [Pyramidobacter sp.]
MIKTKSRNEMRLLRHSRLRNKISGTAERPRMSVFRSLRDIYVQVIDDTVGHTLVSVSTKEKAVAAALECGHCTVAAAKELGKLIAERAKEKGITEVVFDRGGHVYHGRVQAIAEAAREAGLKL